MMLPVKTVKARLVSRKNTTCLVAAFEKATPPMIWQMDLDKLSTFSLMLRETDGEWDLGLALPHGTFTPVAHFDERPDAEAAYAAIRRVLLSKPFATHTRLSWGAFILAFGLFYFWMSFLSPSTPTQTADQQTRKVLDQAEPKGKPTFTPGVPMSADDVLTIPQD